MTQISSNIWNEIHSRADTDIATMVMYYKNEEIDDIELMQAIAAHCEISFDIGFKFGKMCGEEI